MSEPNEEHLSLDEWLGRAAVSAAASIMADPEVIADILSDDAKIDRFAKFVRTAGDVPGESLYRFGAARGLHVLPADSFDKVAPDVRLFFEAFAAVVKALAPILDPPKTQRAVVVPAAPRVDVEDTIFAKYGPPGERTHRGLAPGEPTTTEGLSITRNAPAPAPQPASLSRQPAPLVIGTDALTRFEKGAPPSPQEFAAMTPEERRPYAALFGLPGLEAVMNEQPDAAPAAEALETRDVSGDVAGETIEGTVAIGKTKKGK